MALETLVGMNTFMLFIASIALVLLFRFLEKKIPPLYSFGKNEFKFSIGDGISMLLALMLVSWLAGALL